MKIFIKRLSENAKIPVRGSAGAAGYDFFSTEDYVLKPGERKLFKTNISFVIPPGYFGRIAPRSGLAFKFGADILAGIIDEDFRGDVGIILLNTGKYVGDFGVVFQEAHPIEIKKGDRIAQIIFHKYEKVEFEEVENLDESARNSGGFGSTGA